MKFMEFRQFWKFWEFRKFMVLSVSLLSPSLRNQIKLGNLKNTGMSYIFNNFEMEAVLAVILSFLVCLAILVAKTRFIYRSLISGAIFDQNIMVQL